ncbi:MAG: hypothetical protein AB4058_15530, partial [Microcystaceae cyanobacterium]
MVLTAVVMMTRVSDHKDNVFARKVTFNASSVTDIGITRILNFLNQPQHRTLIAQNPDQWVATANAVTTASSFTPDANKYYPDRAELCLADTDGSTSPWGGDAAENSEYGPVDVAFLAELMTQNWLAVDSNDASKGGYRLHSYSVTPGPGGGIATLVVEGQAVNDSSSELKTNNSVQAVKLTVPYTVDSNGSASTPDSIKLPGMWISENSNDTENSKQSNGKIQAVTWIDCSQKGDFQRNTAYINDQKIDTSSDIIIGSETLTPELKQVKDRLPDVPSIPSSVPSSKIYEFSGEAKLSDCYVTLPRIAANAGENSCGSEAQIDNSVTTDEDVNGVYYYKFTNNSVSLDLSNGQLRIKPPANKKVVIYVAGEVKLSGTSLPDGASHSSKTTCEGSSNDVTTYIGDPNDPSKLELYSTSSSKPIDVSDTTLISAFVHAPKTTFKTNQAQIRGAAWFKRSEISQSNGSGCYYSVKQMDVGEIG